MPVKHKPLPSQEELIRRISYNPETGVLTWKERPVSDFPREHFARVWNKKHANQTTGCRAWNSYGNPCFEVVVLNNVRHSAHRLIWVMVNGSIPEGMVIDHIDRNPFNNRISNLRACTQKENTCNQSIRTNNSSGYRGVAFNKLRNKWMAYINHDGKRRYLGTHNTRWGAYAAYREASAIHGEFSNLKPRISQP